MKSNAVIRVKYMLFNMLPVFIALLFVMLVMLMDRVYYQ